MTARCTSSAGLKVLMLAWVLSAAALRLASAQGEATGNAPADVPREVVLQLAVAPAPLESLHNDLAKPNKPFPKEPEISTHHVFRGRLHFGDETTNGVALIWDQPRQKLYLELVPTRGYCAAPQRERFAREVKSAKMAVGGLE